MRFDEVLSLKASKHSVDEFSHNIEDKMIRMIAALNLAIDELKSDINKNHQRFNEFAIVMKENIVSTCKTMTK